MKKYLLLIVLTTFFTGCSWFAEKPEIAVLLTAHFKNKLYNKFDTAAYKPIFKQKLAERNAEFDNPEVVNSFYANIDYMPQLVTKFFINGTLDSLSTRLQQSSNHGFNANIFGIEAYRTALQLLNASKFKDITQVYNAVADLELATAYAVNKYANFVTFGSVNPKKVINRYYIPVKRPDSIFMLETLNSDELTATLNKLEPNDDAYRALQAALRNYKLKGYKDNSNEIKTIKINLERLRWKLPLNTEEKVVVNIPDFTLTWFKGNDTLTHMRVCVGSRREAGYEEKIKTYLKSGKLDDKPKNHETPQLFSVFNAIQVNPIWNIPVSIAKGEIYWMVLKDPYYLSNNNINVYYKDKLVTDPDTINWAKYPREKLPFKFKQGAGSGNALGKFKFVFDNGSSIYLHDTNAKYAFNLANRAISHGCVRVEDPLKFAELMVKNEQQYDKLRMEVDLPPVDTTKNEIFQKKLAKKTDTTYTFKLKPTWFAPRKDIVIHLAYYTAWADKNGNVQFRNDVYGYDPMMWEAMKRYM